MPVNAGIVPSQPGKTQDEREVAEASDLEGEVLGVGAMDADPGGKVMGDRTSRR